MRCRILENSFCERTHFSLTPPHTRVPFRFLSCHFYATFREKREKNFIFLWYFPPTFALQKTRVSRCVGWEGLGRGPPATGAGGGAVAAAGASGVQRAATHTIYAQTLSHPQCLLLPSHSRPLQKVSPVLCFALKGLWILGFSQFRV